MSLSKHLNALESRTLANTVKLQALAAADSQLL
jgi:hypothetical protein